MTEDRPARNKRRDDIALALASDDRTAYLNETFREELATSILRLFLTAQEGDPSPALPKTLLRLAPGEVDAALDALADTEADTRALAVVARLRGLNHRRESEHPVTVVSAAPHVFFSLPTLPETLASHLRGATCLLRVRALRRVGGRALFTLKREPLDPLVRLESAPDELLVASHAPVAEGVLQLLDSARTLFDQLEAEDQDALAAAIVCTTTSDDDPELDAVFAAAEGLTQPGRLTVDPAVQKAVDDLLMLPGNVPAVDPRTPFAQDRFHLSSDIPSVEIIGRERDVATLKAHVTDEANAPRLLKLTGAEGLGKTTLVRSVLAHAGYADAQAPVMWGGCGGKDQSPLTPFISMLRALSGVTPHQTHARRDLRTFLTTLADFLPSPLDAELVRHEPTLAQLVGAQDAATITAAVDEDGRIADLAPRALRAAIFRAIHLLVGALIARGDGRSVIMVITNASELSAPALSLLSFLAHRLGPQLALVLVSSRQIRLPKAFAKPFAEKRKAMRPLSAAHMDGLLEAYGVKAPEAKRKLLRTAAAGSPLALGQMVRLGLETGLLRREGRDILADQVKARAFPKKIETMVQRRAAVLPQAFKTLLTHWATLGPTFSRAAANFVGVRLSISRNRVGEALTKLSATGYLVEIGPRPGAPAFLPPPDRHVDEGDRRYAFAHPAVRNGILSLIDDDERQGAQDVAASVYEALFLAARVAMPARLAALHEGAGQPERAADLYGAASRRALRLFDPDGARRLAERGLALTTSENPTRTMRLLLRVESALDALGGAAEQSKLLDRIALLVDQTDDASLRQKALYRTARFYLRGRDGIRASDALDALLAANTAPGPRRGRTLRLVGMRHLLEGDPTAALAALVEASTGDNVSSDADRAAAAYQMGLVLTEQERPAQALEQLLQARYFRRRCADPAGEATCLDAVGDLLWRVGRPESAAQVLARAILVRSRIGDDAGQAKSTRDLARVHLALGDLDAAKQSCVDAEALAERAGRSDISISAGVTQARVLLQRGDEKAADRLIGNLSRRSATSAPSVAMEVALFGAEVKIERARAAKTEKAKATLAASALERAQRAQGLGEETGSVWGQVLGRTFLGGALYLQGRQHDALPYTQHAVELLDDRAFTTLPVESVVTLHAEVLDSTGDADESDALVKKLHERLANVAARLTPERRHQYWAVFSRSDIRNRATSPASDDAPPGRAEADDAA